MKIKEIIVVEGKDDTRAIHKSVDADTIETNGSAVTRETIEKIRHAQEVRGVIVLTDPDFPGEKIRKIISEQVPGCKHAFIEKQKAIAHNGKGLGVEHASVEVIQEALREAQPMLEAQPEVITKEDLLAAGLIGEPRSKERRDKLGRLLKIGYTNGKQLHKRLRMFQITKGDFEQSLERIFQEERT
ncbi:ribonuclease M5 [Bacillus sp. J14TS2]|uniref:ribonuclease M5 n=1 Tax=Bacillus sp. J14TS2 TaxID=2807188 RepID=UPI001B2C074C|nr:ribonuclease M5 [Bacillus sp. J14TS2]GIN74326.1 ribonuclease M5 [Bacillus sp. J14TS2]